MDESEQHEDAPRLFSMKKKNVYQTPDDFFSELERETLHRISAKTNVRLARAKRWLELSAAAAIILAALFSGSRLISGTLNLKDAGNDTGFYNMPHENEDNYYPLF